MTSVRPSRPSGRSGQSVGPRDDARRLTRWSLVMLAVAVVLAVVLAVPYGWVLRLLDLREGDLALMAGGWGGWTAETAFDLLPAVPMLVGMQLAVRALRHRARWPAWAALGLNAAGVLWCVYVYADAIQMTY